MPPISRCHDGTLLVPTTLLDAIDSLFGVRAGCCEEFALYPDEAGDLERVCLVPYMGRSLIPMDARPFSAARNMLDCYTLSAECEQSGGEPIGLGCDFCMWCQALIIRDWCDEALDRAGFLDRSPYIEVAAPDSNVEAKYDAIWAHVNDLYRKSPP